MNRRLVQGGKKYGELKARQDSYLDALNRDILASEDFKYIHVPSLKERLDIYKQKFMEFDADHSGDIDFLELKQMLEKLGQPRTHLEAKKLLKDTDRDGRGAINYREFVDLLLGNTLGASILFSEEAHLDNNMNNIASKKKRQAPKPPAPSPVLVKPKKVTFKDDKHELVHNEMKDKIQQRAVVTFQEPNPRSFHNEDDEADEERSNNNEIQEDVDSSDEGIVAVHVHEESEPTDPESDSNIVIEPPTDPPPYEENTAHATYAAQAPRVRSHIPVIATDLMPRVPAASSTAPPVDNQVPPQVQTSTQAHITAQPQADSGTSATNPSTTEPPPVRNIHARNGNLSSNTVPTTPQMPSFTNTVPAQPQMPIAANTTPVLPQMPMATNRSNLPAPTVYPYHYPSYQANQTGVPTYIQPCNVPGCTQCPKVYPSSYPAVVPQAAYQMQASQLQLSAPIMSSQMMAYPAGYMPQVTCTCPSCTGQAGVGQSAAVYSCQHPQGRPGHHNPGHHLTENMASMALR